MKVQSRLSLFCFAIIITFLAGCAGYETTKSDFTPKAQTNMSTQEAIKVIEHYLSNIKWSKSKHKVNLDGITIFPEGKDVFYYPFNKSQLVEIYNFDSYYVPDVKNYIELRYAGKVEKVYFSDKSQAMEFANAVCFLNNITPQERQKNLDNYLRVVRSTPIKVILSGGFTRGDLYGEPVESTFNDILIQWKNKGLPELLQKDSSAQLSDLVINLEQGILKLDLEAKKLKDLADQEARQATAPGQAAPAKTAPAGTLTIAHLLEQRKAILIAILGSVKQAAGQRASGG